MFHYGNKTLTVYISYREKNKPSLVYLEVKAVDIFDGVLVLRMNDDETVVIPIDLIEQFKIKPK